MFLCVKLKADSEESCQVTTLWGSGRSLHHAARDSFTSRLRDSNNKKRGNVRRCAVLTGGAGVHPLHPRVDEGGGLVVEAAAHADSLLRALRFALLMLLSDKQRLLLTARESARALRVLVESPDRVVVAGRSSAGSAVDGCSRCACLLVVGRRVNLVLHVGGSISGRVGVVS